MTNEINFMNLASAVESRKTQFAERATSPLTDYPPHGDPMTWKFDAKMQAYLDAYDGKFVSEEGLLPDDDEHFCVCNGANDGRPMIECSNGKACLMSWFHLECIGIKEHELPDEEAEWFCERCISSRLGKLRENALKPVMLSNSKSLFARTKNVDVTLEASCNSSERTEKFKRKEYNKTIDRVKARTRGETGQKFSILTSDSMSTKLSSPSPRTPQPWSAEFDKAFTNDTEVMEDYDLVTIESAKAVLKAASSNGKEGNGVQTGNIPPRRFSRGTWTKEEQRNLIAVVKECVGSGLKGERMWTAAQPKMFDRGIYRPIGGMKMMWLRELREKTKIDERHRENSKKMRTAIQKSKRPERAVIGEADAAIKDRNGKEKLKADFQGALVSVISTLTKPSRPKRAASI